MNTGPLGYRPLFRVTHASQRLTQYLCFRGLPNLLCARLSDQGLEMRSDGSPIRGGIRLHGSFREPITVESLCSLPAETPHAPSAGEPFGIHVVRCGRRVPSSASEACTRSVTMEWSKLRLLAAWVKLDSSLTRTKVLNSSNLFIRAGPSPDCS
ncbi:hypothetical protein D3C76_1197100 [compost metagenome]